MKKLLLLCMCCMLLVSCASKPVDSTRFMLNTICTVTIYAEENKDKTSEELLDEVFDICQKYENMFSRTIEGSDVYRVNNSQGQPVEVSDETIEILETALYFSELSDGAFDITTAPLSIRWDFEGESPSVPPDDEIKELLLKVDYSKIKIDGNNVTLEPPAEAIDLGAIAKGYIADKMAEYLRENGVTSAIISLGGNIYALGDNAEGNRPFNLGVQDPKAEDGSILGYLQLSDKSLVTSGDYQRYFTENGKRYHHILDPKTGYPAENGLSSVTIISDSSAVGDALSTACFVLGKDKGLELINSYEGVEAIFIDQDENIFLSDGFGSGLEFIENK